MLAPLRDRFDALETRRHALLGAFRAMAPEQLAFHPGPAKWALGDVAQHLSLVDARTTRVLTEHRVSGVTRRRWRDRFVLAPLLGLYFTTGVRAKMPVKGVAPDPAVPLEHTAARWEESRRALAAYLDGLDEPATRAIVYRHPFAGFMDIYETLWFLTRHHDHHLRQVARIRAAPGFPATPRGAAGTA